MTVRARFLPLLALAAVAAGATYLVARGGDYTVHARFADAGQLVEGGVVEIAGRKVGKVRRLTLAADGTADVQLALTDDAVTPLRRGTRAAIRAVGQAGLNNRYVNLLPPPVGGPEIEDGGTLGLTETSGIVDIDALFSMFDGRTRRNVQDLFEQGAEAFAGSSSARFNGLLRQAAPSLAPYRRLAADLAADESQLARLIETAGATAGALAQRPGSVRGAIADTASVFAEINSERTAFADDVDRLGAVLGRGERTLATLRRATPALAEDLERVPRVAAPLATVLTDLRPMSRRVTPLLRDVRSLLPGVERSLDGLVPLERAASPALDRLGPAMREAIPVLAALRVYTPDLILGVFGGLGGISAASYDKFGHYGRLLIAVSPQATPAGFARLLDLPEIPGLRLQTGLTAPCPGAAAPPAPDGSNVWVPDPDLCDPAHGHP